MPISDPEQVVRETCRIRLPKRWETIAKKPAASERKGRDSVSEERNLPAHKSEEFIPCSVGQSFQAAEWLSAIPGDFVAPGDWPFSAGPGLDLGTGQDFSGHSRGMSVR